MIEAYLAADVQCPLIMVGPLGWKYEKEMRMLENYTINTTTIDHRIIKKRKRIVHLEYVPFNTLVALIQGAKGLIFPSLYEGFGLPVLEAMSLRTPVITSNTSSLPEVGGDAPLYIDPYRIQEITDAIVTLDNDRVLSERCIAKGLEQVKKFSPEEYRKRLATIY